uniref:Uncharacterized protein n=1 Tax=Arundo donax TaxID=35708 RepID=A0A0A8XWV7_ARUDO
MAVTHNLSFFNVELCKKVRQKIAKLIKSYKKYEVATDDRF